MTRLLVLGVTAISLLVPTTAGAQKITAVSIKLEQGGTATVPFQGPGLNLVTGAVVTASDGTRVDDVAAKVVHHSLTALSVIVVAAPTARPRPDYQVGLQTGASRTLIHAATVEVVQKPPSKATQPPPAQTTQPPPAQTLVAVSVTPSQIGGGTTVTGTVTLSGVVPSGSIQVTLASDKPATASVPATVTVPAGQNAIGFSVTTHPVAADTPVTLSAALAGTTRTTTLTVGFPRLKRAIISVRDLTHDLSNVLFELDGPAPTGGVTVALASQNTAVARVPASGTVPQAQTFGTAPIDVTRGTSSVDVTLTATYGGTSKTTTVTVKPLPPPPAVFSITPISARPGTTFQICGANFAPYLKLGSLQIGARFDAGPCQTGARLYFYDLPTNIAPGSYTMSMENAGGTWTSPQNYTVLTPSGQPPPATGSNTQGLASIDVDPTQIGGGSTVTGWVTLGAVVATGSVQVTLASNKSATASVPTSVTVPAGQNAIGFSVTTHPVAADTPVTLSAALSGITKTTTLTVGLPRLKRALITVRDLTHDLSSLTFELDGPAQAGSVTVALASQNTAVARVPATGTIPQAQTSGSVPIDVTRGTSPVDVTLTAASGGLTKTTTFTVKPLPPPPAVFSITPMSGRPNSSFQICGTNFAVYLNLGSRLIGARLSLGACPNGGELRLYDLPVDIAPGSYTMSMENAGGIWTSPQNFTVTAP